MAPTFFQELQNSEQFCRRFGARSFSMAEMWRCVSWEKLAPFLSVTLCQSPPWASGGMDFSTASQNISANIWKWKWFMWHVFQVLGKAETIAEHILNWWNALCNVSSRRLKNMQKLRQKVLEDHLWLVASATIQLFWQTNKTNQPQNHSPLACLHRWTSANYFLNHLCHLYHLIVWYYYSQ